MKDNYKKMTIKEVIEKLPLSAMIDVLKAKGLTNEEIIELLQDAKEHIIRENNMRIYLNTIELLSKEDNYKIKKNQLRLVLFII